MKILIYGINFWPELTGVGKYTGEMAEWLASRGHDVQVVTAPPYYPQWKVEKGYSAWLYRRDRFHGIPIVRCPLWIPKRLSALHRIIHLASFAISSAPVVLWKALRWKPNVVFVLQPAFLCTPASWLASRLAGARCWMHVQDFELDAALELGLLKGGRFRQLLQSFEHFWMKRLDTVSTISDHMFDHLITKGISPKCRVMLKNWVDTQDICPMTGENAYRRQLGFTSETIVALYSGNMGRKQGLEVVIEAAKRLRDWPHYQFVLAGDGSMRVALQEEAQGLSNIHFLPLQPVEQLNELLNAADIHLLLQRPLASGFFLPSKLTGMLATGRPIAATAYEGSEIAKAIAGCGLLVPPDDPKAIVEAVLRLGGNPEERHEMGRKGREIAVSLWDKQAILEQFERILLGFPENVSPPHRIHATLGR